MVKSYVYVVTRFRVNEDVWVCKVFRNRADASYYCEEHDGQDDYIYEWDCWEVE